MFVPVPIKAQLLFIYIHPYILRILYIYLLLLTILIYLIRIIRTYNN